MKMGEEESDTEAAVEKKETEKYLLDCLKEMVRIPTFVPPGEHYGEIIDMLIPMLGDLGFECERVDMPADIYETRQKAKELSGVRANLLATKDYGAKESVDLYTHLDVVPADESPVGCPLLLLAIYLGRRPGAFRAFLGDEGPALRAETFVRIRQSREVAGIAAWDASRNGFHDLGGHAVHGPPLPGGRDGQGGSSP